MHQQTAALSKAVVCSIPQVSAYFLWLLVAYYDGRLHQPVAVVDDVEKVDLLTIGSVLAPNLIDHQQINVTQSACHVLSVCSPGFLRPHVADSADDFVRCACRAVCPCARTCFVMATAKWLLPDAWVPAKDEAAANLHGI